jgi:hypothetical protein
MELSSFGTTTVALHSLRADRTENISRGSYCCDRNITSMKIHVFPTEFIGALTVA